MSLFDDEGECSPKACRHDDDHPYAVGFMMPLVACYSYEEAGPRGSTTILASSSMSRSGSCSSFPALSPLSFSPRCGCFESSLRPTAFDPSLSPLPSAPSCPDGAAPSVASPPFSAAPLALLPPELVHHVLGFLDVASLESCYRVCHRWRALLQSAAIWRGAYLALWARSDAALHRADAAEHYEKRTHDGSGRRAQPMLAPANRSYGRDPDVAQMDRMDRDDDAVEQAADSKEIGMGDWESEYDNDGWRRSFRWLRKGSRNTSTAVGELQQPVPDREEKETPESQSGVQARHEEKAPDDPCTEEVTREKPSMNQHYWMKMSLERFLVDTSSTWTVSCYQPPSSTPYFPSSSPSGPGSLSLSSSPLSFSLIPPHSPNSLKGIPPSSYSTSSPMLSSDHKRNSLSSTSPLSSSPSPSLDIFSRSSGELEAPKTLSPSPQSSSPLSLHASSIVYGEVNLQKLTDLAEGRRDPGNRWATNPSCCYQLNSPVTRVWSLHMHNDSRTLFAGSEDHEIRQWDVCRGKCLRKFQGHAGLIWDVKTTDTDLISASEDLAIKVWDIESRRCVKTLLGHTEWVSCLFINGDMLISGSFDNTLKVWTNWQTRHSSVKAKCTTYHNAHEDNIWCMTGSSTTLASGAKDCLVKLWDLGSMKHLGTLKGHRGWISKLQLDSSKVVSGSRDETLRIWDTKTLQCVHTLEIPSSALSTKSQGSGGRCDLAHPIWGMHYDDNKLISAGGGGLVCFWDLRTMGCYHVIEHDPPFAIRSLTFDQTKLVHGGFTAAHSAYMYIYFDIY